ncbi:unnamed protein product [Lasius platythorax]|uniref:Uncharacterized protein n=1 Tax=Lasius platythorax TaxID=488582 RepID=A0AAV2NQD1_9HYME
MAPARPLTRLFRAACGTLDRCHRDLHKCARREALELREERRDSEDVGRRRRGVSAGWSDIRVRSRNRANIGIDPDLMKEEGGEIDRACPCRRQDGLIVEIENLHDLRRDPVLYRRIYVMRSRAKEDTSIFTDVRLELAAFKMKSNEINYRERLPKDHHILVQKLISYV